MGRKRGIHKHGVLLGIVVLLLCTGCVTMTGEDLNEFIQLTPEEYPVTQGSNPTRIISEKLFEQFTGQKEADTDVKKIRHSGTSEAYHEFLKEDSEFDMIIAQQPNPEIEKKLEGDWFKPFAKDALVFITNIDNPIEDLTMDEVKGILSGEVSNWKELGGSNQPINLFKRNESGGSQILLEKYVLQGAEMAEVPELNVTNDMIEMSECVAKETKEGCTFGYTTYYFAEFSGKREDVKTISIDGVKAAYSTIDSEEYPLISQIYIGIKEMAGSAGRIFDWIFTPEGQQLVGTTGYVPIRETKKDGNSAATNEPTPAVTEEGYPDDEEEFIDDGYDDYQEKDMGPWKVSFNEKGMEGWITEDGKECWIREESLMGDCYWIWG